MSPDRVRFVLRKCRPIPPFDVVTRSGGAYRIEHAGDAWVTDACPDRLIVATRDRGLAIVGAEEVVSIGRFRDDDPAGSPGAGGATNPDRLRAVIVAGGLPVPCAIVARDGKCYPVESAGNIHIFADLPDKVLIAMPGRGIALVPIDAIEAIRAGGEERPRPPAARDLEELGS